MDLVISYLIHTFSFTKIKILLSVIFSYFALIIGGYDSMIESMYMLLIMDFILGFIYAWKQNTISKKKMQLGIVKIVSYSVTLIVINYADIATMGADLFGVGIREFGVGYLAINEALSCFKHLGHLGVPIPQGLITKLENYKDNLGRDDLFSKK